MKLKITILVALILLFGVIAFMIKDLFLDNQRDESNPYELDLKKLKEVDSSLICYKEAFNINPSLSEIYGIAIDKEDKIYVTSKDSMAVFDKTGKTVQRMNIGSNAECIAIDTKGKIYLGILDHIEVRDYEGKLLNKWENLGTKAIITSIAINDSFTFVADAGNKVVYRYDYTGKLLGKIGEKNEARGDSGFVIPSPYFDCAIGRDGELWVVNPGLHRFEAYSTNGRLISSWKRTSNQIDGFSGCCNPSHIALLSNGSFVTSEKSIERVKIHLPSGEFKCVVAPPSLFREGTKGLDLAVDSEDRILVLDPGNKLIRVFVEK